MPHSCYTTPAPAGSALKSSTLVLLARTDWAGGCHLCCLRAEWERGVVEHHGGDRYHVNSCVDEMREASWCAKSVTSVVLSV